MTNPWGPHSFYASMLSEEFSLLEVEKKGESSQTFLRFRDNIVAPTLCATFRFQRTENFQKAGPHFSPFAVREELFKEAKSHLCS